MYLHFHILGNWVSQEGAWKWILRFLIRNVSAFNDFLYVNVPSYPILTLWLDVIWDTIFPIRDKKNLK